MNAADLSARLTRQSGSNFYYSFLFLPRRKREAIYALYAFCRTVDDAVDHGGSGPSEQRRILAEWRTELARAYEGGPTQPIAVHLAEVVRTFPIQRRHLEAISRATRQGSRTTAGAAGASAQRRASPYQKSSSYSSPGSQARDTSDVSSSAKAHCRAAMASSTGSTKLDRPWRGWPSPRAWTVVR